MQPERRPWIVLVGGFLGAGKTTLILAAARELQSRGLRSAMVWNDQGVDLVDSRYGTLSGAQSGEVTGGCFCCRLTQLMDAMSALRAYAPDVIFAEPVGSCTDLSATVLRPLLEYSETYQLAPLTVLVDPQRAQGMMEPDADPEMRFLFDKQLQEADLVCFTKSDLSPGYPAIFTKHLRQLSAKSGQGVAAWLNEVLSGAIATGDKALEIDYSEYARAEAALAWLNLRAVFEPAGLLSPAMLLGPLLDDLDAALTANHIPIAHLKAVVSSSTGWLKAAICANGQEPAVEGNLDASPAARLELLLNLRALGEPDEVRGIVEHELAHRPGVTHFHLDCFSPSPPVPERRIPA
ncbi:MAG TPA: GTP-binding protein [Acidobacteriaceae bacterium]|nr:GTP-binding protein [Acidobacteriaceae bacterium]